MQPTSTRQYARRVRGEKNAALLSVRRSWDNMGDDFDAAWNLGVGPAVLAATVRAQDRIVQAAGEYVPDVLAETGQGVNGLEWEPNTQAWGGTTGDGRSVQTLSYGAVTRAKSAVQRGATSRQALASGGMWLTAALGATLADTARSSEQFNSKSRHKPMYVRQLTPPSCGRCIILAGRTYRTAFERHPGCDCVSIPASENVAGDLLTDPRAHLDNLDDDKLATALGSRANAQAYREFGGDQNQLVNSYRSRWLGNGRNAGSVSKAQVYGRNVKYTTEGVTRRGWAGQSMRRSGSFQAAEARVGRNARLRAPRLMPETILDVAESRADAQRLLELYGWVL